MCVCVREREREGEGGKMDECESVIMFLFCGICLYLSFC